MGHPYKYRLVQEVKKQKLSIKKLQKRDGRHPYKYRVVREVEKQKLSINTERGRKVEYCAKIDYFRQNYKK